MHGLLRPYAEDDPKLPMRIENDRLMYDALLDFGQSRGDGEVTRLAECLPAVCHAHGVKFSFDTPPPLCTEEDTRRMYEFFPTFKELRAPNPFDDDDVDFSDTGAALRE